jgi:NAD(P)-dependent dehydrogenase (short-subunit alcohol dehydrogenase family)
MVKLQWGTALVTGGSRGIGRGIVFKLAENGVKKIAINYVENDAAAKDTLNGLKDRGAEGIVIKGDVGKTEFVKAMFAEVKSKFGGLDIFVHNARNAVGQFYQSPMEASVEGLQAAYDSQAKCMLLGCRRARNSCIPAAASSLSPTRQAAAPAAGSPG